MTQANKIELRKNYLKLCLLDITGEICREDGQYLIDHEGKNMINYKEGMEWFDELAFIAGMVNEDGYLHDKVCDYLKGWYLQ